jgi:Flp pilus assembly protein TadG
MTRFVPAFALALAAAVLVVGAASAEIISFKAELSGANEVPAVEGDGKGTLTATYDTNTKTLTYKVDYSGMSGPVTAAHFHGPSDTAHNAAVLIPITSGLASPMQGSAVLTDAQAADLVGGRLYFNVHTAKFRPGEIRGQVVRGQ